jgi:hypothetical protein
VMHESIDRATRREKVIILSARKWNLDSSHHFLAVD